MRLSRRACLSVAGTALTAASLFASVDNTARVTVTPSFPDGTTFGNQLINQSGSCEAAASGTGALNSSGSGTARVEYGFIRLTCSSYGALSTTAFGEFNDTITVHAPGLQPGSLVTVSYSIEVRGVMTATTGQSNAEWTVRTDLGPSPFDMTNTGGMDGPAYAEPGPTGKGFGVYHAAAQVPVGVPTSLHVEYVTTALAANTQTTPGSAACEDIKCWWRGVSSVTNNTGAVSNWSITSQSGTDWSTGSRKCMADFGRAGGVSPGDGRLDNNDFIAFTTAFFQHDPAADVGAAAGMFGSDNVLDSNDFISFITLFFSGC